MSARVIIWRGTFGALALLAYPMAYVSAFTGAGLLAAAGWAFVFAVACFLALESEVSWL